MDEIFSRLPEDILITKIVPKLPVKSQCRFKCVSRSFLTFIQGLPPSRAPILWQVQYWDILHIFRIDPDNGFLEEVRPESQLEMDFDYFSSDNGRYCSGLNCFRFNQDVGFYLFNVMTDESMSIPLPTWCSGDCVFCFDSTTRRYKILSWVDTKPSDLRLLTLEAGASWRLLPNPFNIVKFPEPHAIVNGQPYWMSNGNNRIFSFQPAAEEFRVVDPPDVFGREEIFLYCIFNFEGFLAFVVQHRREVPRFSVWVMKDAWVILRRNITLPFQGTHLQEYYSHTPLGHWAVDSFSFSSCGGELLVAAGAEVPPKEWGPEQYLFIISFLSNQGKRIKFHGLSVPFSDFTANHYVRTGFRFRPYEIKHDRLPQLE